MRLSPREFRAMNNPVRRLAQRRIEFPQFKALGLDAADKDVLEVGCGSSYGAVLLSAQEPRSCHGIDLMSEQIALTGRPSDPDSRQVRAESLESRPCRKSSCST